MANDHGYNQPGTSFQTFTLSGAGHKDSSAESGTGQGDRSGTGTRKGPGDGSLRRARAVSASSRIKNFIDEKQKQELAFRKKEHECRVEVSYRCYSVDLVFLRMPLDLSSVPYMVMS